MKKLSILDRIQITVDLRLKMYDMLDSYISSGIGLKEALDKMANIEKSRNSKRSPLYKAYSLMMKRLALGKKLGDLFDDIAPVEERMVINAVSSNNLKNCFKAAIDIATVTRKMNRSFYGALIYPAVLFTLAYAFLIVFAAYLMPSFIQSIPQTNELSTFTKFGISLSHNVKYWVPISLSIIFGLVLTIIIALPNWKGYLRKNFDNVPPFNMYRLKVGCGFLIAVAGLIRGGVKLDQAMGQMTKYAKPYLRHRISSVLFYIKRGVNLGVALTKTKLDFPDPDMVDRIGVYAIGNNFANRMDILAKEFAQQGIEKIATQAAIARNCGLILVVSVILMILGTTFSITNDLKAVAQSQTTSL